MKRSSLRINPLVMKRCLKNMSLNKTSKKKRENFNEVKHVEDLDETSIFILPINEVVQSCIPPAQEDEEVINSNDADKSMEQPSGTIDYHIDDFMCPKVWMGYWLF